MVKLCRSAAWRQDSLKRVGKEKRDELETSLKGLVNNKTSHLEVQIAFHGVADHFKR
jgi:hypothetical protein